MNNTLVWGFCGSHGREIINELTRSLNITDWLSDQEGSIDISAILMGDIRLVERQDEAVRLFGSFYQQHFQAYSIMINRRGLQYADIHELTHEFALNFYYFYKLMVDKHTHLVIFANLPHEGADYILYQTAKLLQVKTLLCYQSIFPNQFFLTTALDDFGVFNNVPAIFEHAEIKLENDYQQKLFYMKDVEKQQAQERQSGIRHAYLKSLASFRSCTDLCHRVLIMLLHFDITTIARKVAIRQSNVRYQKNLDAHVVDRMTLMKLLNGPKKVVYFPLHLQPELTTSTIGGVFQDQLYALEVLRGLLDEDWVILVKENPKQNHYQRDEWFFKRLSNIAGVYLVDKLFPSVEIIEKAVFTATITGTAGWEAIKGGGQCLVFGHAWYASLDNCLTWHPALTDADLAHFLGKKSEYDVFRLSFENLSKKAGIGVTDSSYRVLVNNYNEKKNAVNVAETLLAVIKNPATLWT